MSQTPEFARHAEVQALLEEVLARPEFASPTLQEGPFEIVLGYLREVAGRIWDWLFRGDQDAVLGVADVVLVAILVGVAAVFFTQATRFILRRWRRGDRPRGIDVPDPSAPSTAIEWRALADAAANDGRLRDAAVALYHSVLYRLSEAGRVRVHPAKTPRDYRREVRDDPELASSLAAFFRLFEPLAFARQTPAREGYERLHSAAAELELGG